jgi:putative FmdB family regulatory protein
MPIFEYRCTKCEHIYEELVARADSPAPACPKCEARVSEKLMSVFAGHVSSPKTSCASGPTCATAAGGGCRSCPMTHA